MQDSTHQAKFWKRLVKKVDVKGYFGEVTFKWGQIRMSPLLTLFEILDIELVWIKCFLTQKRMNLMTGGRRYMAASNS